MSRSLLVRTLAWVMALGLLSLPLVGLFMGWFASGHWPVRSLRVDGSFQHLSATAIRDTVAPLLGEGFFAADPRKIQSAVLDLPWVQQVEVRKHWPDQVRIHVKEHRAFAQWNQNTLIDRRGRLFVVPQGADVAALPHLAGPEGSADRVVRFYMDARRGFAKQGMRVAQLQLDARGGWTVTLDNGAIVTIGKNQPRQRLRRFLDGLAVLMKQQSRNFVSADLRYSNGFALRWKAIPAMTGGPPAA